MEATTAPADRLVEEVESLCIHCHSNGITRLLLTRIPYFKDVILMSFSCPHCHFKNSEIQSAGEIQQRGVKYTFKADTSTDLERQIVKGDSCVVRLEEIDLEIPAGRGQLTNIEGLLSMVQQDLDLQQGERKEAAPPVYRKVQQIVNELREYASGEKFPFTITLDDPSGNSSIEPSPSDKGGKYVRSEYARSSEQNAALGLGESATETETETEAPGVSIRPEYHASQAMYPAMPTTTPGHLNIDRMGIAVTGDDMDILLDEVYSFEATCPGCNKHCVTNMKMVNIPHFKQVVLMSTVCHICGYRSNEVKTGGEIPEKGRKITLQVKDKVDLSRDILKAESCALQCPELDLNVEPGTLGGRFTTVEGLLTQIRDDLKSTIFGDEEYKPGDSMTGKRSKEWEKFFEKLTAAIEGQLQFSLVLQDPLAASYVQSFKAPDPDDQITMEEYERTHEEMEDLGLNDMVTEGYEQDEEDKAKPNEHAADDDATNAKESSAARPPIDVDEVRREVEAQLKHFADNE